MGHVAATAKSANICDAYVDPLFDKEVDRRTGFHTKSILTVPVTDKDNKTLAVIQVSFSSSFCSFIFFLGSFSSSFRCSFFMFS